MEDGEVRGDFTGVRQHCCQLGKKEFGNAGLAGRDNRGQARELMDGGHDCRFVFGGRHQGDVYAGAARGGRLSSPESVTRTLGTSGGPGTVRTAAAIGKQLFDR